MTFIKVLLQPPSPPTKHLSLPPVSTLLPYDADEEAHNPSKSMSDSTLPGIRHIPLQRRRQRLDALEPQLDLTISTMVQLSPSPSPCVSPLSDFSLTEWSGRDRAWPVLSSLSAPPSPQAVCRSLSEPPQPLIPSPTQTTTVTPTSITSYRTESSSSQARNSKPVRPQRARRRSNQLHTRTHRDESGWTFVVPTVCQVRPSPATETPTTGLPGSPSSSIPSRLTWAAIATQKDAAEAQLASEANEAAFTSMTLETPLGIPRKKRGRKPKVQLAGNSCFVWKDLSSRRKSRKIH